MHHHPDRITHTTAFVTPVVEHWLEREIAQWVHTHIYNAKYKNDFIFNIQFSTFLRLCHNRKTNIIVVVVIVVLMGENPQEANLATTLNQSISGNLQTGQVRSGQSV